MITGKSRFYQCCLDVVAASQMVDIRLLLAGWGENIKTASTCHIIPADQTSCRAELLVYIFYSF